MENIIFMQKVKIIPATAVAQSKECNIMGSNSTQGHFFCISFSCGGFEVGRSHIQGICKSLNGNRPEILIHKRTKKTVKVDLHLISHYSMTKSGGVEIQLHVLLASTLDAGG
jgi:hypothetical protein